MIAHVLAGAATALACAAVVSMGCSSASPGISSQDAGAPDANDPSVAYPTLDALYKGDIGMYRTCGPNNSVCHNSRQFPNLATVGSIVEDIGLPCNQDSPTPTAMNDLCERSGDQLVIGSTAIEIAYFANVDPKSAQNDLAARIWRVVLHDPPPPVRGQTLVIRRSPDLELHALTEFGVTASDDASGHAVILQLPAAGGAGVDIGATVAGWFAGAGIPGDPTQIQLGDPNRNGVFGATLGGALIKPGAPTKSYLFSRLTDPSAGPLMPRANCCFWSKTALRALWCWVASLQPDGSNALDRIDYGSCPDGPPDTVVYPEQGPNCLTSGLCPVEPRGRLGTEPTWANIYPNIIQIACTSCHSGGASAQAGLDMGSSDIAYQSLMMKGLVRPHDANDSILYRKITPALCNGDCMPRGGEPLDDTRRGLIEAWIDDGASEQ